MPLRQDTKEGEEEDGPWCTIFLLAFVLLHQQPNSTGPMWSSLAGQVLIQDRSTQHCYASLVLLCWPGPQPLNLNPSSSWFVWEWQRGWNSYTEFWPQKSRSIRIIVHILEDINELSFDCIILGAWKAILLAELCQNRYLSMCRSRLCTTNLLILNNLNFVVRRRWIFLSTSMLAQCHHHSLRMPSQCCRLSHHPHFKSQSSWLLSLVLW